MGADNSLRLFCMVGNGNEQDAGVGGIENDLLNSQVRHGTMDTIKYRSDKKGQRYEDCYL